MSDDWKVGDLALCLDNTPTLHEVEARLLRVGRIYNVGAVGIPDGGTKVCLAFHEIAPRSPKRGNAYCATRFRKIRPDTEPANADDAAWLKDLLKKPSPADPALIEHERRKRERVEIEHQEELNRG